MSNSTLKKLCVTSNITPKILLALVAATLLATLSARAQAPAPTSDIVFVDGTPVLTITDTNPPGPPEVISAPILLPGLPGVVLFYEDPAKTIVSDGIWSTGNAFFFASDPDLSTIPSTLPLLASVVETGAPQDVSGFFGFGANFVQVQSDVDLAVPDTGTTSSLLGLSLMGLAFLRRKLC